LLWRTGEGGAIMAEPVEITAFTIMIEPTYGMIAYGSSFMLTAVAVR
jgi:hypothetical protein